MNAGIRATACAIWLGCTGCLSLLAGGLDPLDISLADVTALESNGFEQRVHLDLRLRNPNNRVLELEGMRFVLELNGTPFVRGVSNERVTVPRLGDVRMRVTATTTLLDMLRQLGALQQRGAGSGGLDYSLRGQVFVDSIWGRELDFEYSGRLME